MQQNISICVFFVKNICALHFFDVNLWRKKKKR